MAFLRSPQPEDYLDSIRGENILLRPPSQADYAAWAELRAQSRAHLTPWEPTWARDELVKSSYRRRLRAYARDVRDDLGYAFFLADAMSGVLLGGITLSNVRRGACQSATLGYWIGAPYRGQGKMQDAVRTIVPFAFRKLLLHRVEAACMVANAASIRVLEKTGFRREGVLRQYLKINGNWEDHVLMSRVDLADDRGANVSGLQA
jgi:[ribosomal protein S5]-alanine N-acetyltransferase